MIRAVVQPSTEAFERHLIAGGEYLRDSRIADACREFEAALSVRPDDVKALGLLGLAHFRQSDFHSALPVYQKLAEVSPQDASYRLNLGLVYLKLGDAPSAIAELTTSRQLDPSQSRTVSYLGLAHARAGEYARAYEAFLQAGQKDLAAEMEQHLGEDERRAIVQRVSEGAVGEAGESVVTGEVYDESLSGDALPDGDRQPDSGTEPGIGTDGPGPPPAQPEPAEELEDSDDTGAQIEEAFAGFEDHQSQASEQDEVEATEEMAAAPSQTHRSEGMVSRIIKIAEPNKTAETAATRVGAGHRAPASLSAFATDRMVRPDDGDHAFELSSDGLLVVRVAGRTVSRAEGIIASGGTLSYEPAHRRVRGQSTDEILGGDRPLYYVNGDGYLIAAADGEELAAVQLSGDILYLREDLVFAFEERVRWESGHVPGSKRSEGQRAIPVIQFRGEGAVALRTPGPLISVKVGERRALDVDQGVLAGWVGRVVPRFVIPDGDAPLSAPYVECSGEGIVLLTHDRGAAR